MVSASTTIVYSPNSSTIPYGRGTVCILPILLQEQFVKSTSGLTVHMSSFLIRALVIIMLDL